MEKQKGLMNMFAGIGLLVLLLVAAGFILPWRRVNWGKVQYTPAEVVVVNGEAKTQQKNQIASYVAGVDAVNDNKETAIKEVNGKVEAIIKAVKEFGIGEGDIKTQNMSIYQQEEMYWDNGVQKARKGQWRINNSIEIKLRDIDKASALTDLVSSSGATNVYGPNFTFDDTSEMEKGLFDVAMQDAKEKAEIIAKTSGRKLGKVISVNEGSGGASFMPMYDRGGAGGAGAPMEPGTGTVTKSLTVTFELN